MCVCVCVCTLILLDEIMGDSPSFPYNIILAGGEGAAPANNLITT